MIKKILFILIIFLGFQMQTQAIENNSVLNLKTGNSYILLLKNRPMNLKVSNADIVKAEAVTNIFEADSSLLITAKKEGISYITFNLKGQEIRIRLLVDNIWEETPENDEFLKLDLPQEHKK